MNTSRSFVECDFTLRKFAGALRSEEPYNVVLIGQVATISEFNSYDYSSENVPKTTPKVKKRIDWIPVMISMRGFVSEYL